AWTQLASWQQQHAAFLTVHNRWAHLPAKQKAKAPEPTFTTVQPVTPDPGSCAPASSFSVAASSLPPGTTNTTPATVGAVSPQPPPAAPGSGPGAPPAPPRPPRRAGGGGPRPASDRQAVDRPQRQVAAMSSLTMPTPAVSDPDEVPEPRRNSELRLLLGAFGV